MYQIYNDSVDDLLDETKTNLKIRELGNEGTYVAGLTEIRIKDPKEAILYLEKGKSNRMTASTNMNKTSSRSHSIFQMRIEQEKEGKKIAGSFTLVDLAGSERVSKTEATGMRLKEAQKINKTLAALGNVINALTDGKSTHVPYRDAKLTFLLRNSLGGNSKTSLILNCSPSIDNVDVNHTLI